MLNNAKVHNIYKRRAEKGQNVGQKGRKRNNKNMRFHALLLLC